MTYVAIRPVNLTAVLHLDLELHLWNTGHNMKPDEFVADLVSRCLSADKARIAALSESKKGLMGYQWKEIFLPAGTTLRTTHDGITKFAYVRGDRILCEDKPVSPSQFVNGGGTGRNAWRFVWIRFPGHEHWQPAARCREQRVRRNRSVQPVRSDRRQAVALDGAAAAEAALQAGGKTRPSVSKR